METYQQEEKNTAQNGGGKVQYQAKSTSGTTAANSQNSITATDVVDSGNGILAVNISSKKSGLNKHKRSTWASVISNQIRSTLKGHAIYAADGDIIRITKRAAGEVGYGTDSKKLFREAQTTGDYSEYNRKMITADHAASIISLSTYSSWSSNTEDPSDAFKRDGINHRTVNLYIDGEPYTAVVLTCLNTDPNQTADYGEKFYDIVSIEKQANQSAMNGTFTMKATPHKIRFADGSPDMLTVAQKQRTVNRKNSTYSSGDISTNSAFAEAYARAQANKTSNQQRSETVTNREILANALEGAAQTDAEKANLQKYRDDIQLIEAQEAKLSELKSQIRELSFGKGPRDQKKIDALRFEAKQTENRINTLDKRLLKLEATAPLKALLERERQAAFKKASEKSRAAAKQRNVS